MARAYEDDLRRKIFEAHAKGHGSFRMLAAVFGVSLGYVEKIFRERTVRAGALQARTEEPSHWGSVRPDRHSG
jgi:transposase